MFFFKHILKIILIEIPHVRQSGKNSADIRMVVDALAPRTPSKSSSMAVK